MIEIPGYRLLRQLGRGGMATVYLALQESVDREVALKVMSPALLADPNFGERFLREAKIAARLHHRHVVGIHDVSRIGDYHYIAMEYLAGGPILSKDGQAREVSFALRVIREIALAINYAQQKGFIHRDVKPDNILLRDDGSSVLTDFGIARANDSATRMTRTGAVVGTPHYMSPEQARGKQIDGRSDLYSLGVVLYEMLVGRVPYHAEDSLAVGIMHITQPVPRLPESLAVLQPLVDGLLAKEPEKRFQTGQEAAVAITRYEQAIDAGELPDLQGTPDGFRREARSVDTRVSPPPNAPRASHAEPMSRQRSEPSFGRLDEIVAAADEHIMRASRSGQRRAKREPRRSRVGLAAFFVVLVLAVASFAAWRYQDRLRGFLPSTELNDVLARAQRALVSGDLDGSQGISARELFQSARTLDPDNDIARRGLNQVGEKLLERARLALKNNDIGSAQRAVAIARELLGGGAAVDEVARTIGRIEARGTETETLLASAQQALDGGHLLGNDGAIAVYQQILVVEPDNALARAGLTRCAERLATQARTALDADNQTVAATHIEDISRSVPGFPALPELRAKLNSLRENAASALEQDLVRGESQLRAGNIAGASGSASSLFESVLQRDRDNVRARAGLRRVAQGLVVQARAALEDSNPGNADKLLVQAEKLAPESAELRAAKIDLRELRERLAIAAERPPANVADIERMQKLVVEAGQAAEAGRLIEPPGNCAYDKYRAALAIDGGNRAALDGIGKLPARARELFDAALKDNALARARAMSEALRQLAPSDAAIAAMSERLATAYYDEAERSIGEKQRDAATRSLKAGRELSPSNARAAAIEQALRELPPAGG